MKDIITFYVTNQDHEYYKPFLEIKNELNLSRGRLINDAIKEYVINHKKKTHNSLENYIKNENFIKTPDIIDNSDKWIKYAKKSDDKNLKEISNQTNIITTILEFFLKFPKNERKYKNVTVRDMMNYSKAF